MDPGPRALVSSGEVKQRQLGRCVPAKVNSATLAVFPLLSVDRWQDLERERYLVGPFLDE